MSINKIKIKIMADNDISTIYNSPKSKERAICMLKESVMMESNNHVKGFGEFELHQLLNYTSDGNAPGRFTDMLIKLLLWVIRNKHNNDFLAHKETEPDPFPLLVSIINFFRAIEARREDIYDHWVSYNNLRWYPGSITVEELEEMMSDYNVDPKAVLNSSNV